MVVVVGLAVSLELSISNPLHFPDLKATTFSYHENPQSNSFEALVSD